MARWAFAIARLSPFGARCCRCRGSLGWPTPSGGAGLPLGPRIRRAAATSPLRLVRRGGDPLVGVGLLAPPLARLRVSHGPPGGKPGRRRCACTARCSLGRAPLPAGGRVGVRRGRPLWDGLPGCGISHPLRLARSPAGCIWEPCTGAACRGTGVALLRQRPSAARPGGSPRCPPSWCSCSGAPPGVFRVGMRGPALAIVLSLARPASGMLAMGATGLSVAPGSRPAASRAKLRSRVIGAAPPAPTPGFSFGNALDALPPARVVGSLALGSKTLSLARADGCHLTVTGQVPSVGPAGSDSLAPATGLQVWTAICPSLAAPACGGPAEGCVCPTRKGEALGG